MALLGKICLLALFSVFPLWADLIIEEVVEKDSSSDGGVTLITQTTTDKGEWKAAFMNAALPGVGHYYLGEKKKGALYLSLDIAALAGAIFAIQTSDQFYADSRAFAYSYADVSSSRSGDDEYWRVIGLKGVVSQSEYNRAMENNRTFDKKYTSSSDYWAWKDGVDGESDYQEEYVDIRNSGGTWKTTANIFLGAMVLNRVVSFIDGRISAGRARNRASTLSKVRVQPHYSPESETSGATISVNF